MLSITVHGQVEFARVDGIFDEMQLSLKRVVVAAAYLCAPGADCEDDLEFVCFAGDWD